MKAWMNGEIKNATDCRLSVLDHGLLYGDGVFEGIRISAGRVFRLADHIQRLRRSGMAIGLSPQQSDEEIARIVLDTAACFGHDNAYVRLLLTRGIGPLGLDPTSCTNPELICIVGELTMFADSIRRQGLRLITSAYRRPSLDMLDSQVKSLNYLNNVLAKREAKLRNYDDALLLNSNGTIAEASGANLFVLRNGILMTPPTADGALPGITRDTLLDCARVLNIETTVQSLTRYDLLAAEEAFLCGSGAGVIGIASLDDTPIESNQWATVNLLNQQYALMAVERGTPFGSPADTLPAAAC